MTKVDKLRETIKYLEEQGSIRNIQIKSLNAELNAKTKIWLNQQARIEELSLRIKKLTSIIDNMVSIIAYH